MANINNSMLFYTTFSNGDMHHKMCIQCDAKDTFKDTYFLIKDKLETLDVVLYIVNIFNVKSQFEKNNISDWKFMGTRFEYGCLYYDFAPNDEPENIYEFEFDNVNYITTF